MKSAFADVAGRQFSAEGLQAEFVAGLKRRPKTLPCKAFYDERGSQLFDEICELDEYYLARAESKILRDNVAEIAALCGPRCLLVEFGSGNSSKTRLLLDCLDAPVAYVPIDISRAHLLRAAEALNGDYFPLEVLPVCADYNQRIILPAPARAPDRTVIFFPGSTIGNFEPWQAELFLRRLTTCCEAGDGLLIGVDLKKNREVLHRAYNDSKGVTAAFNLNLLCRANAELGADFVVEQFHHNAIYNQAQSRIEMRLVSRCKQTVAIASEQIRFGRGEFITTEYSCKYRLQDFLDLCSSAGWQAVRVWMDNNRWFGVCYFQRRPSPLFDKTCFGGKLRWIEVSKCAMRSPDHPRGAQIREGREGQTNASC